MKKLLAATLVALLNVSVVLSLISLVLKVSASTQPSLKVKKLGVSFPQRDPTQSVYEFVGYAGNRGSDMFRIRFEELKDDIFSNFELGLSSDHGRSWSDVERWKKHCCGWMA